MKYNPEIHHRRSIRLKRYNYSQSGVYFITICVKNRDCLFGKIDDGIIVLNNAGKITEKCFLNISDHFHQAKPDIFVVMPNHVHGIIVINASVGAKNFSPVHLDKNSPLQHDNIPKCGTSKTIGSIVRGFKIGVSKWFHENSDVHAVWQRNYYEHIVRYDHELNRIREYIQNNPANWDSDSYNPSFVGAAQIIHPSW